MANMPKSTLTFTNLVLKMVHLFFRKVAKCQLKMLIWTKIFSVIFDGKTYAGNICNIATDPWFLWHIEAEAKWTTLFRRHFQTHFSWTKIVVFWLQFHWNLFPRFQLSIFQHSFTQWLGTGQTTSYYLNQWWHSLLTNICVTRPQWVVHERNDPFL